MSKQKLIFILGIWIALLSFLGFPENWKRAFFVLTGFLLAFLGYLIHKEQKKQKENCKENDNIFTDSDKI